MEAIWAVHAIAAFKKNVEKVENAFRRDRANDLFFFSMGHYSPLDHVKAGKENSPARYTA